VGGKRRGEDELLECDEVVDVGWASGSHCGNVLRFRRWICGDGEK
jgi:hypothetical protein